MPTYNFKCRQCEEEFKVEISLEEKEALVPTCPNCGSEDVFQDFAGVGVISCSTGGAADSPG